MKRFRRGSVVRWRYGDGYAYGIVLGLKRTRYSVFAVHGAGKHTGINWAVQPHHMATVSAAKQPDEVAAAIAAYALTGKVPDGSSNFDA